MTTFAKLGGSAARPSLSPIRSACVQWGFPDRKRADEVPFQSVGYDCCKPYTVFCRSGMAQNWIINTSPPLTVPRAATAQETDHAPFIPPWTLNPNPTMTMARLNDK